MEIIVAVATWLALFALCGAAGVLIVKNLF
jgi:hypothetical protein